MHSDISAYRYRYGLTWPVVRVQATGSGAAGKLRRWVPVAVNCGCAQPYRAAAWAAAPKRRGREMQSVHVNAAVCALQISTVDSERLRATLSHCIHTRDSDQLPAICPRRSTRTPAQAHCSLLFSSLLAGFPTFCHHFGYLHPVLNETPRSLASLLPQRATMYALAGTAEVFQEIWSHDASAAGAEAEA